MGRRHKKDSIFLARALRQCITVWQAACLKQNTPVMGFEADVLTDLRETNKQPDLESTTGCTSAR